MDNIPLFRPFVEPQLTGDLLRAVNEVIMSKWYVLGSEVSAFEQEFAAFCGVPHCVSVGNGTDALEIAMRAVGLKSGDPILLTANAGFYGSTAARLIGAIPIYVDISGKSMTMAADNVKNALSMKPRAIVVTHLYGQLADIEAIVDIANEAGIAVIEDCAQAHGAMRNGRRAGSFGTVGCFSFYPTKNLGALGDGGAIVTNDDGIASRIKELRQYGWSTKYRNVTPGGRNSRLDEIQAAALRVKLPYLPHWNKERLDIARRYNDAFAELPVQCPNSLGEDYVAHLYVIRTDKREQFRAFLKKCGVTTDVHYPTPDYLQPAYQCEQGIEALPITESACGTVVSLPCFPGMEDKEIEQVIDVTRRYFNQERF